MKNNRKFKVKSKQQYHDKIMDERIQLDVSGHIYAVPREIIENGPSSHLLERFKTVSSVPNSESIVINRPPETFAAILAFYQTGELHIPMTSCPGAFMSELEYWGISPDVLSECCYNRLQSFLDDQATLRAFKERLATSNSPCSTYWWFKGCRSKVWEIVEYTKPSLAGKMYFALTFLMVLLSIFVMAFSTDPSFLRPMTDCERLEYMASSGTEDYNVVEPYLQEFCTDIDILKARTNNSWREKFNIKFKWDDEGKSGENNYLTLLVREQYRNSQDNKTLPEQDHFRHESVGSDDDENSQRNKRLLNNTMDSFDTENNTIILDNSTNLMEELVPFSFVNKIFEETKQIKVPNFKAKLFCLVTLEGITTIYFTTDVILRLFTCPFLKGYFLSVINSADALSLLGAYIYLFLYYMYPHLRYGSWIDNLAYVQMLRSFRFFRVVLKVRAGKVLAYSAQRNIKDLSILILFLVTGMCTFASCFYIAEENAVKTIPDAWYWSVITMTTVGYGDIHPQTKIGRLIACICSVCGVLLLALTVPIFANHFLILYQHAESENIVQKFQKRRSQKNEIGRVKSKDVKSGEVSQITRKEQQFTTCEEGLSN